MNYLKNETVKKPKIVGKISPRLKPRCQFRPQFGGKKRAFTGFWNFCLIFAFLSGLIFSQGALANLYEDVGLTPSATEEDIKKAWQKLRIAHHYDHVRNHGGLSERVENKIFSFINNKRMTLAEIRAVDDPELQPYIKLKVAFYILRDPTLKKEYDKQLKQKNASRLNQEAAGNSGQDHVSGGRHTGYGQNQTSGATGQSYTSADGDAAESFLTIISRAQQNKMTDSDLRRVIRAFALNRKEKTRHSINDLNHLGQTAFQLALNNRFFLTAETLIELGAAETESFLTIISRAQQNKMTDSDLRRVIKAFALNHKEKTRHSINDLNHLGQTAFQLALSSRLFDTAETLIELGAEVRPKSPAAMGLLSHALNLGRPTLFVELLRYEAFDFEGAVQDRTPVIQRILFQISKWEDSHRTNLWTNEILVAYLNKLKPQKPSFYLSATLYAFSLNLLKPAKTLIVHTDWMKHLKEDQKQLLFATALSTSLKTAELIFSRGGMTHLTVENQQMLLNKWRQEREKRIMRRGLYIGACFGASCMMGTGSFLMGVLAALLAFPFSTCYDSFINSRLSELYPLAPEAPAPHLQNRARASDTTTNL